MWKNSRTWWALKVWVWSQVTLFCFGRRILHCNFTNSSKDPIALDVVTIYSENVYSSLILKYLDSRNNVCLWETAALTLAQVSFPNCLISPVIIGSIWRTQIRVDAILNYVHISAESHITPGNQSENIVRHVMYITTTTTCTLTIYWHIDQETPSRSEPWN